MLSASITGGAAARSAPRLILTEGGPGAALLRPGRRMLRVAVVLAAATWLPLLVLSASEGLLAAPAEGSFLRDLAAHVRLLVALPVLIFAELPVGASCGRASALFVETGLVSPHEQRRFAAIVGDSARLRDSRVAELLVLAAAGLTSYVLLTRFQLPAAPAWFVRPDGRMTPAGLWYAFVSLPALQFVVFRWFYLLGIWTLMLRRVSRLELRLMPAHADGAGGLGFLGGCSVPFGRLLFAASAVLASEDAGRILFAGAGLEVLQRGYPVLFVVALAAFFGPLLVFMPALLRARQRGLVAYGLLASEYARRFDQKWIEGDRSGEPLLGSPDFESQVALHETFARIQKVRAVPIARRDLLTAALPGLGPLLLLAAATVPLREVAMSLLRLVV
jgi:hypothetical protein